MVRSGFIRVRLPAPTRRGRVGLRIAGVEVRFEGRADRSLVTAIVTTLARAARRGRRC
jgi:hypothetical protein